VFEVMKFAFAAMLVASVALAEEDQEMCVWTDGEGVTHFSCEGKPEEPKPEPEVCLWTDEEGVVHYDGCDDDGPNFFVENE
jgi:hypothetical protein